jgi:hypothetical protein
VRIDCSSRNEGGLPDSLGRGWRQQIGAQMNGSDDEHQRLHDLRRTFVTGLDDLGIRPDLIELAVNHRSGVRGHIAGVYNRSEPLPERKAALETWANLIERLVVGNSERVLAGPGLRK